MFFVLLYILSLLRVFPQKKISKRIHRSELPTDNASEEAQTALLAQRTQQNNNFESNVGELYGSGIDD